MAHSRKRHILPLLLKKLAFNPVLAIQGARQTGKSFLVSELVREERPGLAYVSFDDYALRDLADTSPTLFLSQYEDSKTLAIDEAQKSPRIFDAIKLSVDRKRIPGKFLLLGSTEFSKQTLIRESLTGRMSRIRLFPMNLAETLGLPPSKTKSPILAEETPRVTRAALMKYLDRGGMPGIFSAREEGERHSFLHDWIEITAKRDAPLFPKLKVDPDLCMRILEKVATLDEPDAGSISRALKKDLRRIKTHLEVLTTLFALHPLDPHPSGTGKRLYFFCDVAFSKILGASLERQMHTWLIQEQLSQRSYRDDRESVIYYYRTPKGKMVHLLIESAKKLSLLKILTNEKFQEKDVELLRAYRLKFPKLNLGLFALGGQRLSLNKEKIEIYPWESIG